MAEGEAASTVEEQTSETKERYVSPTIASKPTPTDGFDENNKTGPIPMSHCQKYSTQYNLIGLVFIIAFAAFLGVAFGIVMLGTTSKPTVPDEISVSLTGASYDGDPYCMPLTCSVLWLPVAKNRTIRITKEQDSETCAP